MKLTVKNELFLEILLFSCGMLTIGLLYNYNILLSLFLIAFWFIGIKYWHKIYDIYFFVTGAVVGPIGEIVCIHFGAWQYVNPTFLGIPLWLPFVWGMATMLIKRITETFLKIQMK